MCIMYISCKNPFNNNLNGIFIDNVFLSEKKFSKSM